MWNDYCHRVSTHLQLINIIIIIIIKITGIFVYGNWSWNKVQLLKRLLISEDLSKSLWCDKFIQRTSISRQIFYVIKRCVTSKRNSVLVARNVNYVAEVPGYNLESNPDCSDWNFWWQRYYKTKLWPLPQNSYARLALNISFNNAPHFFIRYSDSFLGLPLVW
jgi:hypothetical protein